MSTFNQWFENYSNYHTNKTNKSSNVIYWISVPLMFFGIISILYQFKLLYIAPLKIEVNAAIILLTIIVLYYYTLSRTLWIGVSVAGLLCITACFFLEKYINLPIWQLGLVLFMLGWTIQFAYLKVERRRPSFLKDLHFLLLSPAWLMSSIYRRLNIAC